MLACTEQMDVVGFVRADQEFHATIYAALGIDPARNLYDGARPVPITDGGRPIRALLA